MNIFELFGGSKAAPAAPASPNAPAGASPVSDINKVDPSAPPAGGTQSASGQKLGPDGKPLPEPSPLEPFAKLWENINIPGSKTPTLNADPVKIGEAAKKLDFSKAVDPMLAQKALAGDTQAFVDVMNAVAQQVFAVSTQASTHLVDRHTAAVREHMQGELPNQLRSFQARDSLMSENPQMAHPAVQPLIVAVQNQLAAQFPQATSAELKKHAVQYLNGVFSVMNPGSAQAGKGNGEDSSVPNPFKSLTGGGVEIDWGDWLDGKPQGAPKQ